MAGMSLQEQETPLSTALSEIRDLLEEGDVEGARALVRDLEASWPDADRVRHYARMLAPPRVLKADGPPGRSLESERRWLREHAHEHPGCWLAVHGDRLIAAHPRLREVLATMRATQCAEDALLHFQAETRM